MDLKEGGRAAALVMSFLEGEASRRVELMAPSGIAEEARRRTIVNFRCSCVRAESETHVEGRNWKRAKLDVFDAKMEVENAIFKRDRLHSLGRDLP